MTDEYFKFSGLHKYNTNYEVGNSIYDVSIITLPLFHAENPDKKHGVSALYYGGGKYFGRIKHSAD